MDCRARQAGLAMTNGEFRRRTAASVRADQNFFRVLRRFRGSITDQHVVRARETHPDDAAILRGETRVAARYLAAVSFGRFLRAVFRRCGHGVAPSRTHVDEKAGSSHGGTASS